MNPLPNSRNQRSSDPYRAARKTHSPADSYDSSRLRSETEAHSRSASDSSTSRLASQPTYERRRDEYYTDDPYAPRQTTTTAAHRQHMRQGTPESQDTYTTSGTNHISTTAAAIPSSQKEEYYQSQKANSYLPYSHHPPGKDGQFYEPPATSMLLESEHHPSFNSPNSREGGGVGSLLQDNIIMDMVDSPIRSHHKERAALDPLPVLDKNKSKKRRRCYGLGRKRMIAIIIIFIIAIILIWFFVWPRRFDMYFNDASLYSNGYPKNTGPNQETTGIQAQWNVTMTADNHANWVPTHVSRLDLDIYDQNTGVRFAGGSTDSFVLQPKVQQSIYFIANLNYQPASSNDTTLQDILASCMLNPLSDGGQPQTMVTLNLMFKVTYHITGLAWTSTSQHYEDKFRCPE